MNNNKLNYIVEILRRYAKNYVANNPNWDHPTLLKKIESKAFRGLEGEMGSI